jgi:Kef-type K+ transport system membrane component KefB
MVSRLTSAEVLNLLIIISVVLITARLFGEVCRKFNLPVVIGEVVAGLLIGPSLLGGLFPKLFNEVFISQPRSYGAFDGLANVGFILLMFVAGIEVDLKQIKSLGKQAASISIMGLIFPFAIGFFTVWFFYDQLFATPISNHFIPAMFFGTALSITALSVIAKVLMDTNLLKTKIGNLVLTAAMIDDFIGWILFSIILTLMNQNKGMSPFESVSFVLLFVVLIMTAGKWLVNKILMVTDKYLMLPGGTITIGICLCFLAAVVTEWLGVRGIFGAFLMGIIVGDSQYFTQRSQDIMQEFVVNIIAPLFFASIGLRINFVQNFNLEIVLIILFIASFAKILGAVIGSRMSGMKANESYAVAFGMNARGAQELALGLLALQAKIIDERIFVGLIVMTIVSILISGPLMKYFLKKDGLV